MDTEGASAGSAGAIWWILIIICAVDLDSGDCSQVLPGGNLQYTVISYQYCHICRCCCCNRAPCPSMSSSQNRVVRAVYVCACVFKLYAHCITCDNSAPTVRQDRDALWRVLLLVSPVPTCRFIIRLGQQTLGTQGEVNVKQIVCLPHCWRASALFARCIRRTVSERRRTSCRNVPIWRLFSDIWHTRDVICLDCLILEEPQYWECLL